jgi:hypothetical protein
LTDLLATQNEIHQIAVDHGFWEASTNIGEKIALIHSELSEALEEYRSGNMDLRRALDLNPKIDTMEQGEKYGGLRYLSEGKVVPPREWMIEKPEGFPVELADAVIRILDLASWLGIDIGAVMDMKIAYNKTRPHLHGRKV